MAARPPSGRDKGARVTQRIRTRAGPPGTQVDGWTVLEHHSQGSYGDVYRAVRTGQEHAGPVALKLALYPWDPRFAREGDVLSRIHTPSAPRLLGRGVWRPAPGVEHPYLVMEWIEGTPLYEWARQHAPSAQQALRLLSQLAQALAATHRDRSLQRTRRATGIWCAPTCVPCWNATPEWSRSFVSASSACSRWSLLLVVRRRGWPGSWSPPPGTRTISWFRYQTPIRNQFPL